MIFIFPDLRVRGTTEVHDKKKDHIQVERNKLKFMIRKKDHIQKKRKQNQISLFYKTNV